MGEFTLYRKGFPPATGCHRGPSLCLHSSWRACFPQACRAWPFLLKPHKPRALSPRKPVSRGSSPRRPRLSGSVRGEPGSCRKMGLSVHWHGGHRASKKPSQGGNTCWGRDRRALRLTSSVRRQATLNTFKTAWGSKEKMLLSAR